MDDHAPVDLFDRIEASTVEPSSRIRRDVIGGALAALATASLGMPARAQTAFPDRVIRLIVPFPPGGATDIIARLLAASLQQNWGQQVVVENKTGASGMIGAEQVARAAPDGYTALFTITTIIQAPFVFAKVPYDPFKDFTPVSLVGSTPIVLVSRADQPINDFADFIRLVKANPGKYSYASFGTGTSSHIVGDGLARKAGLDLAHVPYRGSAPLFVDLLGGQVSLAWVDPAAAIPHIAAGRLKALAVTGAQRSPQMVNVPTLLENGYPGFEGVGWFGMFLPAGVPKPIVQKYSDEVLRVIKIPEVRAKIYELSVRPVGEDSARFGETMKQDSALWKKLIQEIGLKPQ